MTFITMYDSVDLPQIPDAAPAVAGYVGGLFPTFSNLAARFPIALHLSIAVTAAEDAECLDIERGDASPDQAPVWYARQVARGVKRPCFYANLSTMPSVTGVLGAASIPRAGYRLWTAHYTGAAHIEPGSDATQWTEKALGRNLDASLCVNDFFTDPVAKPAANPPHYDWFPLGSFLINTFHVSERQTVKLYDRLRAKQTPSLHPNRAELAVCRRHLGWLAGRVYRVAHDQPRDDGRPSWNVDHRGWRFHQLSGREQGQRFV